MKQYRVWAEISLDALKKNIETVRKYLKSDTKILAVIKADAYGHGAVPIAWTALEAGVYMLGVGDSSEAIQLRESGIRGPILILGAIIEEEIAKVVEYDIATTIHSMDFLGLLNEEARRQRKHSKVHLKVDTGMGRLGASPTRAIEIAKEVVQYPYLEFEGLCTHLSSVASQDKQYTMGQLDRFSNVIGELKNLEIHPPLIHTANSVSTFMMPDSHFNMVRVGISIYGIDPGVFSKNGITLSPVLSLKTRIAFIKSVSANTCIGYDQKYKTPTPTRIATIPVGYNDGYPYLLSNKAYVLIHGQRAPLVGTVTMDYIMVDIGNIPDARVGDEVTLIGKDGDEEIKVEELAKLVGTIPYEITCAIGKRVKRVYV